MARKIPINLYVEPDTHKRLEQVRKETGVTTAEFLRRLVDSGLDNYEKTRIMPKQKEMEESCKK